MKRKQYCVLTLISNDEPVMYKGEVSADAKPDDMHLANKNISVDVAYFDSKKDRDWFYMQNDTLNELSKRTFKSKPYYFVFSFADTSGMKMFKGKVFAEQKPIDVCIGDNKLAVYVDYFDSKKDRNMFYDSNVMDESDYNQSFEDGAENEAVLDDSKPCLADKIESASTRAPEAPSVNKTPTKEINPIR